MSTIRGFVQRVQRKIEQQDAPDDDFYWGNMFMLLFLTWAVLLYLFTPSAKIIDISFETVLIFLVISSYSLILFNQIEILRKRVAELSEQ